MKRALALVLALCLCVAFSQLTFAAAVQDNSETGDHTVVRLWITDGKNLPDTNNNNPLLLVRVVDETGALIPNATVTLHLVKPVLSGEIAIKSEQNGSTAPTQGSPAKAVEYRVFGPDNPEIQYLLRANASGYRESVTQPFEITFSVSGTIEIKLQKRDAAADCSIAYAVRSGDKADVAFTSTDVKKGEAVGSKNVPQVTVPQTPPDKWRFDGYYINEKKYTAEELAGLIVSADTVVEIRTILDNDDNGADDRSKDEIAAVKYTVRSGDKGVLAFTEKNVKKGAVLGTANVPKVMGLPAGWTLEGYYVEQTVGSAEILAKTVIARDTFAEVRTMPDQNQNGIDDRIENKTAANLQTDDGKTLHRAGAKVPKTGAEDGYAGYILGLSISLLLLVLVLAAIVYRMHQEKKKKR